MVGRRLIAVLFVVSAAMLASAPVGRGAPPGWPTFGFDVQRSGLNPVERDLGPTGARRLAEQWSTNVGASIFAQPVVALDVATAGGLRVNLVIVATNSGWLVALDMQSGDEVWRRYLGAARPGRKFGCPTEPHAHFGITGTPVIERSRNRVYAVGGDGRAYALGLADGTPVAGWPVRVADRAHEHVWGGLTLWRHILYTSVASYCDQPPFAGRVVALDTREPARYARWRVTGNGPRAPDGGGVWGWGGVSVDPRDGNVYAATGNALTRRQNNGYAEHVVRLSPRLRVKGAQFPFRRLTVGDQDFGSTPLLYRAPDCPAQLAALNKDGEMLVYRRHAIGAGPVQRLHIAQASSSGGKALLGLPAYDAPHRRLYVVSPETPAHGRYRRGLLAFRVNRGCRLAPVWRAPAGVAGLSSAPVVANGVVYLATGSGHQLRAVRASDGAPLRTFPLGPTTAFSAPTPVSGAVIVAASDGRVHLLRPR